MRGICAVPGSELLSVSGKPFVRRGGGCAASFSDRVAYAAYPSTVAGCRRSIGTWRGKRCRFGRDSNCKNVWMPGDCYCRKRGVDVVFEHVGMATWDDSVASLA